MPRVVKCWLQSRWTCVHFGTQTGRWTWMEMRQENLFIEEVHPSDASNWLQLVLCSGIAQDYGICQPYGVSLRFWPLAPLFAMRALRVCVWQHSQASSVAWQKALLVHASNPFVVGLSLKHISHFAGNFTDGLQHEAANGKAVLCSFSSSSPFLRFVYDLDGERSPLPWRCKACSSYSGGC